MKKLLFVLSFTLITNTMYSQIYMAALYFESTTLPSPSNNPSGCIDEFILIKIDPTGNISYDCLGNPIQTANQAGLFGDHSTLSNLNQGLNSIINQGYKLTHITDPSVDGGGNGGTNGGGLISHQGTTLNVGTVWYFAVPWSASGLDEVTTTLNNLRISPNPANEFVNISLNYDLKGESEIVFISEAGYLYHKESVGSISKNETYNIDISKIPAGKYLVTIKNGKTYTTPQKLIIL